MKDGKMMIELLEGMEKGGTAFGGRGFGPDMAKRRQNARLLCDEGLAAWESEALARITNAGHSALQRLRKHPEQRDSVVDRVTNGDTVTNAIEAMEPKKL